MLSTLLMIFVLLIGNKDASAQNREQCEAKLKVYKDACAEISPDDELSIKFINTVDGITIGVLEAGAGVWSEVYELIEKLETLVNDVKNKRCTSSTCSDAESIKSDIEDKTKEK